MSSNIYSVHIAYLIKEEQDNLYKVVKKVEHFIPYMVQSTDTNSL